jgi:isopenicillin-N N-acyltransferase like protein
MQNTHVLPLIEVAGTHREMGRQFGEQLRDEIHEYSDMWLRKAAARSGLDRDQLLDQIAGFIAAIDFDASHLGEEVRGVAEGAGLDEREAFSIQVRMELLFAGPPPPSCTTFAIAPAASATGETIVGQNVDLDAEVERFGLILRMCPRDQPAVMMYTSPGLISYVGMNDAGLAVHGNLLVSRGWRAGFPRYLLTRLMLEHSTVDDALEAGLRPKRASSRNLILGDASGNIANAELTVDEAAVTRAPGNGCLVHTNHYLSEKLADAASDYVPESSVSRCERMSSLVGSVDEPLGVEQLQQFFRDHDGYPGSICAHPTERSSSKTVASLISEPASGRMHVTAGSPCEHDYQTYAF